MKTGRRLKERYCVEEKGVQTPEKHAPVWKGGVRMKVTEISRHSHAHPHSTPILTSGWDSGWETLRLGFNNCTMTQGWLSTWAWRKHPQPDWHMPACAESALSIFGRPWPLLMQPKASTECKALAHNVLYVRPSYQKENLSHKVFVVVLFFWYKSSSHPKEWPTIWLEIDLNPRK